MNEQAQAQIVADMLKQSGWNVTDQKDADTGATVCKPAKKAGEELSKAYAKASRTVDKIEAMKCDCDEEVYEALVKIMASIEKTINLIS